MENLIIIGNGFDLAHGLKTSYSHFLHDLTRKVETTPSDYEDIVHVVAGKVDKPFDAEQKKRSIKWKNKLLKLTTDLKNPLWSDMEYLYFKVLQCYNDDEQRKKYFSHTLSYKSAKEINDEFEKIKKLLSKYLQNEQQKFKKLDGITYFFSKHNSKETTVLNFNYTETVSKHLSEFKNINLIDIHGELGSWSNPIIFGFAPSDIESEELTSKDDNELMRNIKRINYKLADNEYRLKTELSNDENKWIDITILGHSFGVSDRHILNDILNHNCINAIRLLYHGKNEGYRQVAINIDRIADDYSKGKDEQKVFPKLLNYKMCSPMLQHDSSDDELTQFKAFVDEMIKQQNKVRDQHTVYFPDNMVI